MFIPHDATYFQVCNVFSAPLGVAWGYYSGMKKRTTMQEDMSQVIIFCVDIHEDVVFESSDFQGLVNTIWYHNLWSFAAGNCPRNPLNSSKAVVLKDVFRRSCCKHMICLQIGSTNSRVQGSL
jgi:hypothetical protein